MAQRRKRKELPKKKPVHPSALKEGWSPQRPVSEETPPSQPFSTSRATDTGPGQRQRRLPIPDGFADVPISAARLIGQLNERRRNNPAAPRESTPQEPVRPQSTNQAPASLDPNHPVIRERRDRAAQIAQSKYDDLYRQNPDQKLAPHPDDLPRENWIRDNVKLGQPPSVAAAPDGGPGGELPPWIESQRRIMLRRGGYQGEFQPSLSQIGAQPPVEGGGFQPTLSPIGAQPPVQGEDAVTRVNPLYGGSESSGALPTVLGDLETMGRWDDPTFPPISDHRRIGNVIQPHLGSPPPGGGPLQPQDLSVLSEPPASPTELPTGSPSPYNQEQLMPPTLSNLTGPLSDINKALYGDMPQLERPMTELERLRKRQEGETPRTTELGRRLQEQRHKTTEASMANEMTRRRMGSPEDRATTQFLKNRGKLRAAGVADDRIDALALQMSQQGGGTHPLDRDLTGDMQKYNDQVMQQQREITQRVAPQIATALSGQLNAQQQAAANEHIVRILNLEGEQKKDLAAFLDGIARQDLSPRERANALVQILNALKPHPQVQTAGITSDAKRRIAQGELDAAALGRAAFGLGSGTAPQIDSGSGGGSNPGAAMEAARTWLEQLSPSGAQPPGAPPQVAPVEQPVTEVDPEGDLNQAIEDLENGPPISMIPVETPGQGGAPPETTGQEGGSFWNFDLNQLNPSQRWSMGGEDAGGSPPGGVPPIFLPQSQLASADPTQLPYQPATVDPWQQLADPRLHNRARQRPNLADILQPRYA